MFEQVRQKIRAGRALISLVRNPESLDKVFELEDALPQNDVDEAVEALSATEEGRRALATQPLLGTIDLGALAALPEGSLGHAFAAFCDKHGLDPNELQVTPPEDGVGAWIIRHMRETHDLWHVLTGFEPDVAGELGLQAFYLAQIEHALMGAIITAGFLNAMLFAPHTAKERVAAVARGWTLGRRALPLFGAPWVELWEVPVEDLRQRYGIQLTAVDEVMAA